MLLHLELDKEYCALVPLISKRRRGDIDVFEEFLWVLDYTPYIGLI